MLEKVLDLAKGYIQQNVTQSAEIPAEKKEVVTQTIVDSVKDNVQQQIGSGLGANNLMSLFGSGGGQSDFYKKTENSIASALTTKAGLNSTLASTIAATIVPGLINIIKGKLGNNDGEDDNIVGNILGNMGL